MVWLFHNKTIWHLAMNRWEMDGLEERDWSIKWKAGFWLDHETHPTTCNDPINAKRGWEGLWGGARSREGKRRGKEKIFVIAKETRKREMGGAFVIIQESCHGFLLTLHRPLHYSCLRGIFFCKILLWPW